MPERLLAILGGGGHWLRGQPRHDVPAAAHRRRPEQFSTWEQLESYTGDLVHTGVIEDFTEIRWDVRPSPRLGTIEVRACDAATNLTELAGMAALTQCLVESFSRTLDRGEELDSLPDWYVAENKWRSARYGMDAILIVNSAGEEELVGDTVERMLTELAPVAEDLGCAAELDSVRTTLETGPPTSVRSPPSGPTADSGRRPSGCCWPRPRGRPLRPTEVLSLAAKS